LTEIQDSTTQADEFNSDHIEETVDKTDEEEQWGMVVGNFGKFNFKEIVGVTNVIQIKNENELVC
jgi:hypothetical protein